MHYITEKIPLKRLFGVSPCTGFVVLAANIEDSFKQTFAGNKC